MRNKIANQINVDLGITIYSAQPIPLPSAIDPSTGLPIAPDAGENEDDLYIKRLNEEDQKKNKDEMLARPDDLIFLSPMLVGFALKNKLWCKRTICEFGLGFTDTDSELLR